jgi:outer membrane protein assembly factor BamB
VLERNKNPSRDGHFVQPTLTKAAAATMAKDAAFAATFPGAMWASPLYFENGPGGKGVFFAVTTGNDVFALDETTGAVVWMKNLGQSPSDTGAGCGSIKPVGILSTPVIDATSRTIFVAGAFGTSKIERHEVHALSVDDGTEVAGWPVDVTKLKAGDLAFEPAPQNQRSALSLVGGKVYVAYGGHVGDCGNYHGWVVAIDAKDPTKTAAWATLGKGEAIWAAGGMASDGTNIYAVTGNSTSGASSRTNSDSEAVVRIHDMAALDRSDKNIYFPASWQTMDGQDADFGASSPLYLSLPGSTPENYVLAIAKDGHMYVLDSTNLGGMGGHVVDFQVSSGSMSVRTTPSAYTTPSGTHVTFSTTGGAKCPSGSPANAKLMSVLFDKGAPPKPKVVWCAAHNGEEAPIATTTDGQNEAIVWYMSEGKLLGVDGETGAVVFNGGSDTCSNVKRWSSPIAVKGRIIVGGDGHLCSWSPH